MAAHSVHLDLYTVPCASFCSRKCTLAAPGGPSAARGPHYAHLDVLLLQVEHLGSSSRSFCTTSDPLRTHLVTLGCTLWQHDEDLTLSYTSRHVHS